MSVATTLRPANGKVRLCVGSAKSCFTSLSRSSAVTSFIPAGSRFGTRSVSISSRS